VQEIAQTQSSPGDQFELLKTMKFDSHGNIMEAREGYRKIGTSDVHWKSEAFYRYDASRRLTSSTELIMLDPVYESECAFSYSETGDLTMAIRSHEKRFERVVLFVYSQKRVKTLEYAVSSNRPLINVIEYDDKGIERTSTVGQTKSSRSTYNERGRVAKFEAYEGDTLIAYETMLYNERNDLTETAHYRSGDILAWRDQCRYEYDEVGNWTSNECKETDIETGRSPAKFWLTKRSISYYNALPPQ
jgi:hypothetical protein